MHSVITVIRGVISLTHWDNRHFICHFFNGTEVYHQITSIKKKLQSHGISNPAQGLPFASIYYFKLVGCWYPWSLKASQKWDKKDTDALGKQTALLEAMLKSKLRLVSFPWLLAMSVMASAAEQSCAIENSSRPTHLTASPSPQGILTRLGSAGVLEHQLQYTHQMFCGMP